jgi:vitamin B12 transporter
MRLILVIQNVLQTSLYMIFNCSMELKPIQTTLLTAAVWTASSLFASSLSATEETEITDVGDLPEYVVVATRTPLSLDRVSPSVSYISDDEMELWQDRDLTDTLRRQTGMALVTSGGIGTQTSLFTRGTESNHTAFFVDGRRMNNGFGNQYGLESLNLGNLSSVQIQRGASSVNYGSSGIGGVVDLQTDSGLNESELTGSVSGEIGSNNYKRADFETRYGTEQYGLSISGGSLSTDNERDNDDYETSFVNGRFDFMLSEVLSFEVIGLYSDSEKELAGSVYSPTLDDVQNSESWLLSPGFLYATDDLSVHAFYSRSKSFLTLDQVKSGYDSYYNYLGEFPVSNDIEVVSDELNLQIDYSINDDVLVTFGGVYRRDEASNSNLITYSPLESPVSYSENFEQAGVFAQVLWILGDVELRAGVRYDDYSDFDAQATGNVEAIYKLDSIDAAIFAKVATSYAPPGASDIAYDSDLFYSDASTELEPEESTSYELGWRQSLLENTLNYSFMFFHNDIDELIDYVFDPSTYLSDAVNVEEAMTEGVEFQASYTGFDRLELSLAYTYLTALADYQDNPRTAYVFGSTDAASDIRLARRPRHQLQLSANYQFTDNFRAGVQGLGYFDREDYNASYVLVDAEDYFVVRLVADWQINEALSVFARVENLLDEQYAPATGYTALGRAGYIGARLEF